MGSLDAALHARGLRVTPQRELVLGAVHNLRHGTPEEILAEVQRTDPSVNLSTVYRALDVLQDVGLVRHAHLGHGAPVYHAHDDPAHIHLVCDACGEVQSVPAEEARRFVGQIRKTTGFQADVTHAALHGTCERCAT